MPPLHSPPASSMPPTGQHVGSQPYAARLFGPLSRRLYLRIWLAVVGGVLVFAVAAGWAWRWTVDQQAARSQPPLREISVANAQGALLFEGQAERQRNDPAQGVRYRITTADGQTLTLNLSPRPMRHPPPPPDMRRPASWVHAPFSFVWILALVGLAVTLGVYPIIRRLLQRLESLQRSVQRFGEGDLSVRVAEQGQDEVADLARQFNAAAQRIETLVQSHKSLLANASHELRSPLARIRMGLALLPQTGSSGQGARAEIERNITELDQLVDEILLASRLDAGAPDVGTVESVDMLGLAAEECARVDAQLHLVPAPAAGANAAPNQDVQGVARLLRRALRNLLENARRYSQGDISMALEQADGAITVWVTDHGPGVPLAQRERIFEPFYRLPGASERAGGVGLGLALVRSIAQRHGGSVHCQDRPDGQPGACFVLRLPQ